MMSSFNKRTTCTQLGTMSLRNAIGLEHGKVSNPFHKNEPRPKCSNALTCRVRIGDCRGAPSPWAKETNVRTCARRRNDDTLQNTQLVPSEIVDSFARGRPDVPRMRSTRPYQDEDFIRSLRRERETTLSEYMEENGISRPSRLLSCTNRRSQDG